MTFSVLAADLALRIHRVHETIREIQTVARLCADPDEDQPGSGFLQSGYLIRDARHNTISFTVA